MTFTVTRSMLLHFECLPCRIPLMPLRSSAVEGRLKTRLSASLWRDGELEECRLAMQPSKAQCLDIRGFVDS